jgi:hypothetical protein
MKATIIIKQIYDDGEIHTLELFQYRSAFVLHKHVLTENNAIAGLYQKSRKFWTKWYCRQELVITKEEYCILVNMYKDKSNKTYENN